MLSIFISSYPNTDKKLDILNQSIQSVSHLDIPIILASPLDISQDFSEYPTIKTHNELVYYYHELTLEEIQHHWYKTRYRVIHEDESYSIIGDLYIPQYHWASLNTFKECIRYARNNGIKWVLWFEGDQVWTTLNKKDLLSDIHKMEKLRIEGKIKNNGFGHYLCTSIIVDSESDLATSIINLSKRDYIRNTYPNISSEHLLSQIFEKHHTYVTNDTIIPNSHIINVRIQEEKSLFLSNNPKPTVWLQYKKIDLNFTILKFFNKFNKRLNVYINNIKVNLGAYEQRTIQINPGYYDIMMDWEVNNQILTHPIYIP